MDNLTPHRRNLSTPRSTSPAYSSCWAHLALLVLVCGYIGLSALDSTPDANIGLGMGLLALSALGVPWTLPLLTDGSVSLDTGSFVAVAAGGAVLNLALHAAALVWWQARATRRRV